MTIIRPITGVHADLNLLVALDALLRERSVQHAAARLGVSQPAMSRTLGRLRTATGDPLLVRSGRVMVPTPYAESVAADVHRVTEAAQALLQPAGPINLSHLHRTFVIRAHDALIDAVATALIAQTTRLAPGVRLTFLAETDTDHDGLHDGTVDLVLSADTHTHPNVRRHVIATADVSLICREDHPALPVTEVTQLASLRWVTVSRRGHSRDRIDQLLGEAGLTRNVVATVPTVAAALRIVADTELITMAPATTIHHRDLRRLGLHSQQSPLLTEPSPVVLGWHRRHDHDPPHRWLRELITTSWAMHAGPAAGR